MAYATFATFAFGNISCGNDSSNDGDGGWGERRRNCVGCGGRVVSADTHNGGQNGSDNGSHNNR